MSILTGPALALLQMAPLQHPVPEGDVPFLAEVAFAALNPAVIGVSFWLGGQADQHAKVLLAAFAGAIAGIALIWFVALLHIPLVAVVGRAGAGVFVLSLLFGLIWAELGYRRRSKSAGL